MTAIDAAQNAHKRPSLETSGIVASASVSKPTTSVRIAMLPGSSSSAMERMHASSLSPSASYSS